MSSVSASYTLSLNAKDVYDKYSVDSQTGYKITSDVEILRSEIDKIRRILGTFREVEICEESRANRERKFNDYVQWQNPKEWENIAEYTLYKNWQARLSAATQTLNAVKQEFKVTNIEVLR